MNKKIDEFFQWYEQAVVDARSDIRFFRKIFLKTFRRYPSTYREDFCGTFQHSVEWIKINRHNQAWALDLDPRPLDYGRRIHWSPLKDFQKKRLHPLKQDVRSKLSHRVDFATALNFSYWLFKRREDLKSYFRTIYESLNPQGLFLLDCMGGSQLQELSEDKRRVSRTSQTPAFTYYWQQKSFDPISHEAQFAIHFQRAGSTKKVRNVFTYDWRIWTIAEIKELLLEVGFDEVKIFWEGTTKAGEGNGIFKERKRGEICEVWVVYIVGVKRRN